MTHYSQCTCSSGEEGRSNQTYFNGFHGLQDCRKPPLREGDTLMGVSPASGKGRKEFFHWKGCPGKHHQFLHHLLELNS